MLPLSISHSLLALRKSNVLLLSQNIVYKANRIGGHAYMAELPLAPTHKPLVPTSSGCRRNTFWLRNPQGAPEYPFFMFTRCLLGVHFRWF